MSNAGDSITVVTSPSATTAKPRRRSRAVSNLTRQQIQHKRDQDRRAQRALRERNKSRVKTLESTITCLTTSQSEEAAIREAELRGLQEENRQLKHRLQGLSAPGVLGSGEPLPSTASPASWTSQSGELSVIEEEEAGQLPWATGWFASPDTRPSQQFQRHDDPVAKDPGSIHLVRVAATGTAASPDIAATPHSHDSVAPATDFVLRDLAVTTTTRPAPPVSDAACQTLTTAAVHSALPLHLPPTCPLDHILLGFLRFHSNSPATDDTQRQIAPPQLSLKAYLHPELSDSMDPISRVMNEVLSTFTHVRAPEKISFMYVMHRTMRWQLHPTESAYADLPRWLRPTATQITVPHAAWIDNIPWPGVRDTLIENPEKYPFQVFSSVYSQCVTVSWPYDAEDAISEIGEDFVLNKIFEKHIQRLGNWTVSRHFEELYPEMCGKFENDTHQFRALIPFLRSGDTNVQFSGSSSSLNLGHAGKVVANPGEAAPH